MSNRGVTLIEVVVAMVVLVVGLVSTLTLFPVGLKAGRRARQTNEAALLGQRLMQELHLAKASELLAGKFPGGAAGEEAGYRWQYEAEEIALEGVDGATLCRVLLTLEWESGVNTRREQWVSYIVPDEV
ncbi:MAG: prepilin-type N-terminal cleavage/methylation domain-containing protein [Candidatus Omnitrophica bacterium]|nr:prepilin-type N-terminal cleavage/methylation domain-containing protein [Candidatus Omnitrophota bacterium]